MGKHLKFLFLATITTLMVLAGSVLQLGDPLMAAPSIPRAAIANQLYAQYPDIPRAQQAQTTLLSRFINYHLNEKSRPAQYHLDWELSMADYLAADHGRTTAGMTAADRQAMQTLSRQQRHQLVSSLEQLFTQ